MEKQHILDEIKRTAAVNGAKPLGHRAFSNHTGIMPSDWGKYWPRFGDAVRAAGLAPNEMTRAYDRDFLIEKLVQLSRELGHIPVVGEIRIKAQNDEAFPSEKTLRRLGPKGHLVQSITDFCQRHGGLADVIAMCEKWTSSRPLSHERISDSSREAETLIGFVYLMKSGRYYKLGHTVSVGQRQRQLAIQLPEKLQVVHEIRTDDPVGIEAYWHNRFAAKRRNGEWFDLAADDVRAFKRRKFM